MADDPSATGSPRNLGAASDFVGLSIGVGLFNRGLYWEAHEAWEHEWVPDRQGRDAGFYKGLIQVAAGCLHSDATTGAARSTSGAAGPATYVLIYRCIAGCGSMRWSGRWTLTWPRWTAAAGPTSRCRGSLTSKNGRARWSGRVHPGRLPACSFQAPPNRRP